MEKKQLKRKFIDAYSSETVGDSARGFGPESVCVNTIVDKEGRVLGFSNYPEDYKNKIQAEVIVDLNLEKRMRGKSKDIYIQNIRFPKNNGDREIRDKVMKQFLDMGYKRKKKE